MEKSEIEDYIKKLQLIEKELSSEENEDIHYLTELNTLLNNLNSDVIKTQSHNSYAIKVKFKKLQANAVTPSYAKDGDAGLDLVATKIINETMNMITYGTDISVEIPEGYVGLIFPRSSIRKYELELTNSVGVIDSGYRGEIQATFNKTHYKLTNYSIGDRIAQIMIIPYPKVTFEEVDELSSTERGTGGFGSTGA